MTTVVLSPLRKQGDVSKVPAAPTARGDSREGHREAMSPLIFYKFHRSY
jgi:hypothetical protein